MEESTVSFLDSLRSVLNEKLLHISSAALPGIKAAVPEFKEVFETLTTSLFNANLLEKDIYKSSSVMHELKLPSDEPIESEKKEAEFSFRLYEYLRQLGFLKESFDFSSDSISMKETDDLKKFFEYINWSRLSPASASPVESILGEIEHSVNSGDNSILKGIIRDSRSRLSDIQHRILNCLEDTEIYLREKYKLDIRSRIMSAMEIDPDLAINKPEEILLLIKKHQKSETGATYLNSELTKEILREDYSENSAQLRNETLERIKRNNSAVEKMEKPGGDSREENAAALLHEGLRILSAAGPSLVDVSLKIIHNYDVINKVNRGMLYRLWCFLTGRRPKQESRRIDVVLFNEEDETSRKLKIDIDKLSEELSATGYRLVLTGNRNSKTYLNILKLPESAIEKMLIKHLKTIRIFLSKLPALDLYMKNNSSNAMKAEMKGFKLDLNDIHSCLNKANKRLLEYQSSQMPAL